MVVFGGDKNVSVERGNFIAPSFRMWVAVLMHYWWHGFIKERQLVVLNVDNLKLRVLATLQNIEYPLCHRRGFPPRPRTAHDDSNLQHVSLSPSGAPVPSFSEGRLIKIDVWPCCQDSRPDGICLAKYRSQRPSPDRRDYRQVGI